MNEDEKLNEIQRKLERSLFEAKIGLAAAGIGIVLALASMIYPHFSTNNLIPTVLKTIGTIVCIFAAIILFRLFFTERKARKDLRELERKFFMDL